MVLVVSFSLKLKTRLIEWDELFCQFFFFSEIFSLDDNVHFDIEQKLSISVNGIHRTSELSSSFRLTQADSRISGNDRVFLLQNINRQWDLELSSIKTTQEMVLGIYFKSPPKIRTKLWKCQLWSEPYHSKLLALYSQWCDTKFRWVRRLASSPVEDSIEDCQKFNFEVPSLCTAVWTAKL